LKTGRLLKFNRKDAEVHAYLYQEGATYRAAIYVSRKGVGAGRTPDRELTGASGALVEDEVRAWVDSHYPR
jgi:hypothetical protein